MSHRNFDVNDIARKRLSVNKQINVEVAADSFGTHTHQIFCGLNILKHRKLINLKYIRPPRWMWKRSTRQLVFLRATNSDQIRSHVYDLNDSADIANPEALAHIDCYHKRSYSKNGYKMIVGHQKINPLGFNYQMQAGSFSDFIKRTLGDFLFHPYNPFANKQRPHIENIVKYARDMLIKNNTNRQILYEYEISRPPVIRNNKTMLFQCSLWDPAFFPHVPQAHINNLNVQIISVVRALAKEFGESFIGGLQGNEYTQRIAKDLIIRAPSNRRAYLQAVNDALVVVTTNGISDSIGWKMGEFVAASKAIVCEPLQHIVVGEFKNEKNYLEFNSVDQCVNNCKRLVEDQRLNVELSSNCFDYYNNYLRPDMLVLNSLIF